MTWDLKANSWQEFPRAQRWFANGEALAHLRYLEEEYTIFREVKNNTVLFTLKGSS